MVTLRAAYGQVVLEEALVPMHVPRDHHEALMQIPHRCRVRVPVVLPHAEHGATDP